MSCRYARIACITFAFIKTVPGYSLTITDVNSLLTPSIADALVKSVGIAMDHRPYEPATGMGTSPGISLGIELTLTQPPSDLATALGGLSGSSSSAMTIPILPVAKIHLHKGLSSRVDLGLSILPPVTSIPYIGGSFLIGGDLKVVIWEGDEGPTWSIRGSYNVNSLSFSQSGTSFNIKTTTLSPQLIISKKLTFADPYIGVGFEYTYGNAQVTVDGSQFQLPSPAPAISSIILTQDGSGIGAFFLCGLQLKIPNAGLGITFEGAYSPYGMNYLGTKLGVGF